MKNIYFVILSFFISAGVFAQVGIGTTTPAASSALDITSSNTGLLIPRIALLSATDVATVASPATSLLIYNTATAGLAPNNVIPGYYYWNATKWVQLSVGTNSDWSLIGNGGTTAGTNFIGTTDTQDLRIKTNNTNRWNISNANSGQLQSYSLGTAALPTYSFQSDQTTGIFSSGTGAIDFSSGGTARVRIPNANQLHALSLGTNALPFYSFSSDTDTGIYSPLADNLSISTAAVERVRVEADGDVGIGATPNASAKLEVNATNRGLLIPNVALTAKNAAGPITTPATSLLVYNTATAGVSPNNVIPGYYYWNGAAWVGFTGANSNDWSITGNSGTTTANYIGTSDVMALKLATNGTERMRVLSGGQVIVNNTGAPFASDRFSVYNTTATDSAINGYSSSTGIGVYGQNSGTNFGVWGDSVGATSGVGVYGQSTGLNSTGTMGLSTGSNGDGVYGQASGATAYGVWGLNNNATGNGAVGTSTGNTANGVLGIASGTFGYGVNGNSTGASGHAVFGNATGATAAGVYGVNNTGAAVGVYGTSTGATANGVNGTVSGISAIGVAGTATGTNGIGVFGSETQAGRYGVLGQNNNATGIGVYGNSFGNTATGVLGAVTGTGGYGVSGTATGATGYGVYGINNNNTGNGVVGSSTGTTGVGVQGVTSGTDGTGVIGSSTGATADGVYGQATGASGYGVWGVNNNASGRGVVGSSSGTSGVGVFGSGAGATGAGIQGNNTSTTGTGIIGGGNNAGGAYLIAGSGGAFNGTDYGSVSWGTTTASGTGTVAAGNNQTIMTLPGGAGGAFTGYQWGVTGISTITGVANDGTDRAVLQGTYTSSGSTPDNVFVGAQIGGVNYKILGTGGGSVSTTMKTSQGERILFAPEAPENWFFDVGEVQLVNGIAKVQLDPIFVETISDSKPFKVFVQGGENTLGSIRITRNQNEKSFVIEDLGGPSNGTVQYNIYAIWKGKENLRFPELREDQKPKPVKSQSASVPEFKNRGVDNLGNTQKQTASGEIGSRQQQNPDMTTPELPKIKTVVRTDNTSKSPKETMLIQREIPAENPLDKAKK